MTTETEDIPAMMADIGRRGALGDAHDHRPSGDVGKGLLGQARGGQPCGNENEDRHERARNRKLKPQNACL